MKPSLSLNQVLTAGILYRLRYEFAAHEGLMLNSFNEDHPEMQVFNMCEGFRQIMDYALEAVDYLTEHELKTYEDIRAFAENFPDPVRNVAITEALGYALSGGWQEKTGEISEQRTT